MKNLLTQEFNDNIAKVIGLNIDMKFWIKVLEYPSLDKPFS